MRMLMRYASTLSAGAAISIALACITEPAYAFEGQARIGIGFGHSYFSAPDTTTHGIAGGIHGILGVDDTQALTAEFNTSYHPTTGILALSGGIGGLYFLDYFQAIPYFGLITEMVAVQRLNGGCDIPDGPACTSSGIGFSIPFGVDYMISRSFVVGVQGRYHLMALGAADTHQMFTTMARAEFMFPF